MVPSDGNVSFVLVSFLDAFFCFFFFFYPCVFSFLCSTLHLQMGDESEPVTKCRAFINLVQAILEDCCNHCCFTVVLMHQSDIFIHGLPSVTMVICTVSMVLNPEVLLCLISGLCDCVSSFNQPPVPLRTDTPQSPQLSHQSPSPPDYSPTEVGPGDQTGPVKASTSLESPLVPSCTTVSSE